VRKLGCAVLLLAALGGCARKAAPARGVPPAVSPAAAAPAAPAAAAAPPSYELRLGKKAFQHYCQSCHGETGGGDGFNAFNLDPRPRDISEPAFQKKKTDAELADAIQRGGAGVGLSALMPPWGKTLSRAEIEQVVLYIRSLKKS
jgi:mono/diheme cytochrome c family protein